MPRPPCGSWRCGSSARLYSRIARHKPCNEPCHLSPVTCHLSPVTCHLSPVTGHLSPVTCQQDWPADRHPRESSSRMSSTSYHPIPSHSTSYYPSPSSPIYNHSPSPHQPASHLSPTHLYPSHLPSHSSTQGKPIKELRLSTSSQGARGTYDMFFDQVPLTDLTENKLHYPQSS